MKAILWVVALISVWSAIIGAVLSLVFAIILAGYFFARVVSSIFALPIGFTPQLRRELKVLATWGALVFGTILMMLISILMCAWLGIDLD
jgi:hypothetical protein